MEQKRKQDEEERRKREEQERLLQVGYRCPSRPPESRPRVRSLTTCREVWRLKVEAVKSRGDINVECS